MSLERYHFKHEGKDYELPLFNQLKLGKKTRILEAFEVADSAPQRIFREMIELTPETKPAIEDMSDEQFLEVLTGWFNATTGVVGK